MHPSARALIRGSGLGLAAMAAMLLAGPAHVMAQTAVTAAAAAPAAPVRPAKPTPRLPDGTIDLGGNGSWSLGWITNYERQLIDTPNGIENVPFLPWTRAMYDYVQKTQNAYDPEGFCLPPGGPRAFGTPYPAQFLQQKNRIVVIFEGGAHVWREIFMDGRAHPTGSKLNPTYFGHSVGRWEGDTLVIDTVGYNERTWLGFNGFLHTDELHTIERITRPNYDTLHYEATIDDPGAYSKPWRMAWNIRWTEGQDLQEYICQEENQFLIDLKDDFGEPFFQPTDRE